MGILVAPTAPAWLANALAHVDEILVDHAHCEKKAASTALSLLFRHPDRTELLLPLSRLAREELRHFEEVVRHLRARGVAFGHQEPAPYASALLGAVRRTEPGRLLDTLLCMALIEARSCERMGLLAAAIPDPDLAALYGGLLESEARHQRTYVGLARRVAPDQAVGPRLHELAVHEASLLARTPAIARMHA